MDLTFEEFLNLRQSDNILDRWILACLDASTKSVYEKYAGLLDKFKIDTKKMEKSNERKVNNTMLTFDKITSYPQFREALYPNGRLDDLNAEFVSETVDSLLQLSNKGIPKDSTDLRKRIDSYFRFCEMRSMRRTSISYLFLGNCTLGRKNTLSADELPRLQTFSDFESPKANHEIPKQAAGLTEIKQNFRSYRSDE